MNGGADGQTDGAFSPGLGGQGYLVSVRADELIVERLDFAEGGVEAAPAWTVPLPAGRSKALSDGVRAAAEPVPAFPADAVLEVATCNTENRQGRWIIALACEFPSARMPEGARVHDYEIRVRDRSGAVVLTKRFVSPAFAKLAKDEPGRQRFWFDTAELPREGGLSFEVRARNCFGRASSGLQGVLPAAS